MKSVGDIACCDSVDIRKYDIKRKGAITEVAEWRVFKTNRGVCRQAIAINVGLCVQGKRAKSLSIASTAHSNRCYVDVDIGHGKTKWRGSSIAAELDAININLVRR